MEGVKTKSGRKVHRPAHFNPAAKQPSRRRGPYRRIHDSRICKICQRGHSPQSNMIVFCDGCNTPFHQLCHDPPIDDLVIAVAEAEWFCALCAKKREEKPLSTGLSGTTLTDDEKRTYLASLPLSSLVELVFFCEKMHPDLPLYDPQTKKIVAGIKSANVAAVAKDQAEDATPGINGDGAAAVEAEEALQGGVPNWEDMIVRAIAAISDEKGSQAKAIFEWLGKFVSPLAFPLSTETNTPFSNYPALDSTNIRSEAQGSLQSALRKNRLLREGHSYKINPEYISKSLPATTDSIPVIAPGSGIKLPPETEDVDGLLVDDDLVAFSHRFHETGIRGGVVNGDVGGGMEDDAEGDLDVDAEGVEDVVM